MEALEALNKYWGYTGFRPGQKEIIDSVISGHDTLALMPTGGGKSICYQIPALCRSGIAIVISPLIALMKDQVEGLVKRGIPALCIHSGLSYDKIDSILDNAVYGNYKLLYVSPERLETDIFKARVAKMDVSMLIVDECHCISQWGYDFRPAYLEIARIKELLPEGIPTIAVTATATPIVVEDIKEKLCLKDCRLFKTGFERDNLSYIVRETDDKTGNILRVCNGVQGTGIVYARERKTCMEISNFLNDNGIQSLFYHAGLDKNERNRRQDDWMKGKVRVMVATNAFGMGIDKEDVRFVVHYDMPESMEAYFQEAGRAGRDGRKSYALLLWNSKDVQRLRLLHSLSFPSLEYMYDIYQKVFNYLNVPFEEGKGRAYKFQLSEFARHFSVNPTMSYYAIKYIEREGYWELTDTVESPAKAMFIVNRDSLYGIQLKDPSYDILIKAILRMYSGMFSKFNSLDIPLIARLTQDSTEGVMDKLKNLSQQGIISLRTPFSMPLLIMNYERLTDRNFYLPEERYKQRKEVYRNRLESMISYASENEKCRSRSLVEYFGQSESADCGSCDVCLSRRKLSAKEASAEVETVENEIISLLQHGDGKLPLSYIKSHSRSNYSLYGKTIEKLVEKGIIKLEGDIIVFL